MTTRVVISNHPGISRDPNEAQAHRCGRCWGPYGKSAIPCPNEPKRSATNAINVNAAMRAIFAEAAALEQAEGSI